MKTIVVGRHTGELPPEIEVVEQKNKTWPTELNDCMRELLGLVFIANKNGIEAILFQNIPGILAVAIARLSHDDGFWSKCKLGVIVSRPGPRLAGISKTFKFYADPDGQNASRDARESAELAAEAVKFANGRAIVAFDEEMSYLNNMTVTVDPVAPFEFDHIEWF